MSSSAEPNVSPADVTSGRFSSATDWGLAALLSGACVLLMAPPMTIVMVIVAAGKIDWNADEVRLIGLLSVLPMVCLLGLAAFGLVAALKGQKAAKARGETAGLASAGVLACTAALVFTLLNFLGGFFIADDMIRNRALSTPPEPRATSPLLPPAANAERAG